MSDRTKEIRARIMKRVHALLQKTVTNGATEQEAMSAAALAAKLMAEHDLTLIDVEQVQDDNPIGAMDTDMGKLHDVRFAASGIELLTGTKYYRRGALMTFFGRKRDTEIATNMLIMVRNAMDGEWAKYKATSAGMRQIIVSSTVSVRSAFLKAMAARIAMRLAELAEENRARMASTERTVLRDPETGEPIIDPETGEVMTVGGGDKGTALVIQKDRDVADALKATGMKINSAAPPNVKRMPLEAKLAGWDAGGRVGLGGIGGSEAKKIEG